MGRGRAPATSTEASGGRFFAPHLLPRPPDRSRGGVMMHQHDGIGLRQARPLAVACQAGICRVFACGLIGGASRLGALSWSSQMAFPRPGERSASGGAGLASMFAPGPCYTRPASRKRALRRHPRRAARSSHTSCGAGADAWSTQAWRIEHEATRIPDDGGGRRRGSGRRGSRIPQTGVRADPDQDRHAGRALGEQRPVRHPGPARRRAVRQGHQGQGHPRAARGVPLRGHRRRSRHRRAQGPEARGEGRREVPHRRGAVLRGPRRVREVPRVEGRLHVHDQRRRKPHDEVVPPLLLPRQHERPHGRPRRQLCIWPNRR